MESDGSRALALSNYGHFTSMRVVDGQVRGLSLHMERLVRDCHSLFGAALDVDHIREQCRAKAKGIETAVVRVTVFDPELDIGHPYSPESTPQILVTARPAAGLPAPPLRAQTVRYQRDAPGIKHVGIFGTIYLRRQAQLAGFDDVLFIDPNQNVYEGATWNIGFVSSGEVIWADGDRLPGVTMRLLQDAHHFRSAYVPRSELPGMQAAFATNANVGVRPLASIDSVEFDHQHPVVAELQHAYADIPTESF